MENNKLLLYIIKIYNNNLLLDYYQLRDYRRRKIIYFLKFKKISPIWRSHLPQPQLVNPTFII